MTDGPTEAEVQRARRLGGLTRAWGCLVVLVGVVAALIGAFVAEDGVGTALVSLGGSAVGVGAVLLVHGVLTRVLVSSRS